MDILFKIIYEIAFPKLYAFPFAIGVQGKCKTLASLTTSSLTNFTLPLKLIRYFQLYLTEVSEVS